LLKLAARPEDAKDKPSDHLDYLQYNAFRWLRDSDFEPDKFKAQSIPAEDANRVLQGLVRFASLSDRYSKHDGLGVLNLGKPLDPTDDYGARPMCVTAWFQILANVIVFAPLCMGMLFLWLSFRAGHRKGTRVEDTPEVT
jgi:hypothetical protein